MNGLRLVPPVLLWIYVLVRRKAVRESRTERALLLTFGAAAVGATLEVSMVAAWLDRLTGAGANVAQVVKHIAVLGAAAGAHEIVRSFALPPDRAAAGAKRRLAVFAVGAVVLVTLFALAPVHDAEAPELTVRYATEPVMLVYWAVFLTFLSSAFLNMVRLTIWYLQHAKPSPLRTGLIAIGLGAALGLAYAAHKVLYLALRAAGVTTGPVVQSVQGVGSSLLAAGTVCLVAGCSWPALAEQPLARRVAARRAYRTLTPLWRDLTAAAEPDPADAEEEGVEAKLYGRVIEIRDAELALRPWVPRELAERAQATARELRVPARHQHAAAEAACLEVARRCKARGAPAVCVPATRVEGVADFADDVRALVEVARQRRDGGHIADLLDLAPSGLSQRPTTAKRRHAGARVVTEVFSPVYLAVGILLVVGAVSTRNPVTGAGWGLLAALFAVVVPYGFLLHGIRRGRYSDRHVRIRQQRTVPLLIAGCGVVTALALITLLGAPRQLVALVLAMLAGQFVTLTITLAWKVSVHTGVAAGVAVVLTSVFGPSLSLFWLAVALVAWARVRMHDHTPAQVVAGAVMGGSIAASVFSALR